MPWKLCHNVEHPGRSIQKLGVGYIRDTGSEVEQLLLPHHQLVQQDPGEGGEAELGHD